MNTGIGTISNFVSAAQGASGAVDTSLVAVVAAVIERRERLLLGQRAMHKAHGGLWEFPGGKVDPGESREAALGRELAEELALAPVTVGDQLGSQTDHERGIHLCFHRVVTDSVPILLEHMALGWFRPAEALALDLAPLDRAFLEECADQVLSGAQGS